MLENGAVELGVRDGCAFITFRGVISMDIALRARVAALPILAAAEWHAMVTRLDKCVFFITAEQMLGEFQQSAAWAKSGRPVALVVSPDRYREAQWLALQAAYLGLRVEVFLDPSSALLWAQWRADAYRRWESALAKPATAAHQSPS